MYQESDLEESEQDTKLDSLPEKPIKKERTALLAREGSPADAAMVMSASTLLNLSESMTRN